MTDAAPGTVTATLRLSSVGAKAVLALFLGVHLYLVIVTLGAVHSPLRSIVAFIICAAGAILLTARAPEPFPAARSAVIIVCVVVISILVNWNLPDSGVLRYESWPFGADTILLLFLALRGRTALAWAGWFLTLALTILWCVDVGRPATDALSLLSTHAGTLLVGSLFALGLRRTSRRIAELHDEQAVLVADEAAAVASAHEQTRQSDYLELIARPAIERIAAPEEYSSADREHWLQLEAAIRDSLRAPALMIPDIVAAATHARERGVTVTLLDDSTEAPHSIKQTDAAIAAILTALEHTESGDFTARILPAGRDYLATIVAEVEDDTRVLNVPL